MDAGIFTSRTSVAEGAGAMALDRLPGAEFAEPAVANKASKASADLPIAGERLIIMFHLFLNARQWCMQPGVNISK